MGKADERRLKSSSQMYSKFEHGIPHFILANDTHCVIDVVVAVYVADQQRRGRFVLEDGGEAARLADYRQQIVSHRLPRRHSKPVHCQKARRFCGLAGPHHGATREQQDLPHPWLLNQESLT
eukprot:1177419-Prorocentrum_minimum.AAC.7